MKNLLQNLGIILILLGSIVLIICAFVGETNNNTILFGSLFVIIIGLIAHIVLNKKIID